MVWDLQNLGLAVIDPDGDDDNETYFLEQKYPRRIFRANLVKIRKFDATFRGILQIFFERYYSFRLEG